MEWNEFQIHLSNQQERCDKCKKILYYSPGKPGYIYDSGAIQYCPECMTIVNDSKRLEKTLNQKTKKKSAWDYF